MSTRMDLLLIRAGISYRQYDYWIRRGWINPRQQGLGSGNPRDLGPDEEQVLLRMGRLVSAGLKPEVAAELARSTVVEHGIAYTRLGPDMVLMSPEVRHG